MEISNVFQMGKLQQYNSDSKNNNNKDDQQYAHTYIHTYKTRTDRIAERES